MGFLFNLFLLCKIKIMIEITQNGEIWEVWQGSGLQHYGDLESCGKYIQRNYEELEEWVNE